MTQLRLLACVLLCALSASVSAQGRGGPFGPLDSPLKTSPAASKGGRDLVRPDSKPGHAAPLDIRIEGEGVSLPPGVSADEKPADDRASTSGLPGDGKSKPEAKRP